MKEDGRKESRRKKKNANKTSKSFVSEISMNINPTKHYSTLKLTHILPILDSHKNLPVKRELNELLRSSRLRKKAEAEPFNVRRCS